MVPSDSLLQAPSLGNGYHFYLWSKGLVKINTLNFQAYSGWGTDVVLHIKPPVTRLIGLWACTWWTVCFQNLQSHRPWWIPDSWVDDTCNSLRIFPLWFQISVFRNSFPEKYILSGHLDFFFPPEFRGNYVLFSVAFSQHKETVSWGIFADRLGSLLTFMWAIRSPFNLRLHSLLDKNWNVLWRRAVSEHSQPL